MSLIEKTASELLDLQAKGQTSAVEIIDAFLAAVTAREPKLQSFMLPPDADAVRKRAAEIDTKRKSGKPLGKLAGVSLVAASHDSALEFADVRKDAQVSACLAANAEDAEDTGVFASQEFGGNRGGCGRAQVRKVVRGNDKAGGAAVGVEEDVSGLNPIAGGFRILIDFDQLHAERMARALVTRHDQEHATRELHLLMKDFRSNPKKFLRIKLSIF